MLAMSFDIATHDMRTYYYDMNLILYRLFTPIIHSTIDQSSATGEKGSKFDSSRDRYV